jgi:hypothetical protein
MYSSKRGTCSRSGAADPCSHDKSKSIVQKLPYDNVPKRMRIAIIHYVVYWLNLIPKRDQDYSPKDLMFGEQKIDCKLMSFKAHVQVHYYLEVTNNVMESRTTGAINLGPTGNIQGTHRFISLKTGDIIL